MIVNLTDTTVHTHSTMLSRVCAHCMLDGIHAHYNIASMENTPFVLLDRDVHTQRLPEVLPMFPCYCYSSHLITDPLTYRVAPRQVCSGTALVAPDVRSLTRFKTYTVREFNSFATCNQ